MNTSRLDEILGRNKKSANEKKEDPSDRDDNLRDANAIKLRINAFAYKGYHRQLENELCNKLANKQVNETDGSRYVNSDSVLDEAHTKNFLAAGNIVQLELNILDYDHSAVRYNELSGHRSCDVNMLIFDNSSETSLDSAIRRYDTMKEVLGKDYFNNDKLLLVGVNPKNSENKKPIDKKIVEKVAKSIGAKYIECSTVTGHNINTLRQTLALMGLNKELKQQDQLDTIIKSYISHLLEKIPEDTLRSLESKEPESPMTVMVKSKDQTKAPFPVKFSEINEKDFDKPYNYKKWQGMIKILKMIKRGETQEIIKEVRSPAFKAMMNSHENFTFGLSKAKSAYNMMNSAVDDMEKALALTKQNRR